nr:hypothetical protein [Tanacetum cinerariifolium]
LWHQRLSHLNFDTINDLAKNDLIAGLPKFKYHKEHLCPSYEQGKSKRASHPPKPVPNSRQRLHLLHMDLCGPMRIASINEKRYVLVIVDDYSRYTWNGVVERHNRTLVEAARTMLIFSRAPLFLWAEAIATVCFTQNRSIIHRRFNKTPYELINGRKPDISFLYVFGALCYPKNDREDIGKLGAKGDIGFFIGYSADSCAYGINNRRTKKIMETINVSFDELSAMAFEQRSELDLLFEAMYDDYIGGQPSATTRTVLPAQEPQVRQTSTASTTIADIAPIPTNSSSLATNVPITSQDVDELNPNAMVDGNTFVNPFANSSTSAAASSSQQNVDPSNMHTFYQPYPHEFQWTKDHPLEQVIGEPSRLVLTRNQLRSDGDMCMYALLVSTMEPKNVKEGMTDPAWIDSIQKELLQFKRLDIVGGNGGNKFKQYAGQNARNPAGYNDVIRNQQASTSGTQIDSAPVYDTDGSAEEAAKFVGDFKSLANEADASLAKHKALELEIEGLLKAVVSHDIMIIVQNESVVDTSDLQSNL